MTNVNFDPFAGGEIQRIAPTTAPQQEIITSSKMSDEANTAFNEAVSLRISGQLDIQVLEKSCNALVRRHDILRATFSSLGNEICLQEPRDLIVEYEDLRSNSTSQQRQAIEALYRNIAISPMNLEEGPLFFLWLKQLADTEFELIMAAHHVVADGWSIGLLLNELAELYRQGGDASALPEAPSFFDFSERSSASQALNPDVDYWLARFQQLPPVLELPLDKPRPGSRSFRAARYDYELQADLAGQLPKAASALKSSLVNYVLAAYFTFLHRVSGNLDIVVGLPVAGQAALKQPNLVGHMVQLLPIRLTLEEQTLFSDVVASVKSEVLNASDHPDFTFGQLLENFTVDRSRVPLVNTIFNIDQAMPVLDFGTASGEVRSVPRAAENFELFLNVVPSQGRLVIEATYSTALFSEATIVAWLGALESILCSAVKDHGQPLSAFALSDDVPDVLKKANTGSARPVQFPDLVTAFGEQSRCRPGDIAVISGQQQLTYSELDRLSSLLAAQLLERGVGEGAVVGLCSARNHYLLVSTLAILKTGAAYLPLDPEFPQERLDYMLRDSGAIAVVEDDSAPVKVREADIVHISLADFARTSSQSTAGASIKALCPAAERMAYMIYTSGSTGTPKGVRIQNSAMINFLESMVQQPGVDAGDRLLALTTLSFDISVLELFAPIISGGTTVVASQDEVKDGESLAQLIDQHSISIVQATPSTWRMLLASDWAGTAETKLKALCGGEPLPADLAKQLLVNVKELWNMYGPTETTVWSTCKRIRFNDTNITVGSPIANTQLYILDANLKYLPLSVPGELCIGGSGVTLGYHNRDELNDDRFIEHPVHGRLYRTGDLAKVLPSGEVQVLGRLDDQVKLRGYRIELGEIEAALKNCQEVERAAVYLWELSEQDVRVVACCVPVAGKPLETIAIRKQLRETLPGYMLPQYFLAVEDIPLTPNKKVNRRALPRPELSESSILEKKVLQSEREKQIAKIWAELLAVNVAIGRDDNFFELGGHSLLALEAIRRIETATGGRLSPGQIVADRLSTLAEYIDTAIDGDVSASDAVPEALPQMARRRLSPDQSRMLRRQLHMPESTCNNLPAAWLIEGELQLAAFQASVLRVIERQTALRTEVKLSGSEYHLVLRHITEVQQLECIDVTASGAGGGALEQAIDRALQLAQAPFAMLNEPLYRLKLYRVGEQKFLFAMTVHQLIFDGWSFDIFLTELEVYYQAALESRAATLEPLSFQSRDHSEWVASRTTDSKVLDFHRHVIEQQDYESALVDTHADKAEFGRRELQFNHQSLIQLESFCERAQLRLHEALLAIFAQACCRVTGEKRLLLGMPVTGRYIPEVIGLIGSFVSTLPCEVQFRSGALFEAARDIAEQLRIFYQHQDVSFAELVSGTEIEEQFFPAVLPISFAYQDIRNRPRILSDMNLRQIDMGRLQTEVPLEFWTRVQPESLIMVFDYDAGQVSRAVIDKLEKNINQIMGSLEECVAMASVSDSDQRGTAKKPFWRRLFQ